jgi:hypothetical protein
LNLEPGRKQLEIYDLCTMVPTVVTLADERRVVVVGRNPNQSKIKVYDEFTDDFSQVSMPPERSFPQYPGLHLLPAGEIFTLGLALDLVARVQGERDPVRGNPYFKYTNPTPVNGLR